MNLAAVEPHLIESSDVGEFVSALFEQYDGVGDAMSPLRKANFVYDIRS